MNIKSSITRYLVCVFAFLAGSLILSILILNIAPFNTVVSASPNYESAQTVEISGTVTLLHAYIGAEELALQQVVTDALTANPGLTVTLINVPFNQIYDLYQTQVLSGAGPDMFVAPNDELGNHVRSGVVTNVDDYLQGRLTNVHTTAIEGMKVNNNLYGVPESAKAVALFYRKSDVPTPPATTADLLALVQSGDKLIIYDGVGGGDYFNFGFWGAFGGQLMDETGRCIADRDGFTQAMEFLVELQNAGAIISSDYGQANDMFKTGAADMLINGPWALKDLEAALGNNLGLTPIPDGPVNPASPLNGTDGFYINPNTGNFTSTVELALFMANQSSSQTFTDVGGHVPIRTDVVSSDPLLNTFSLASSQGFPRPQNQELNNYWGPFGDMLQNVFGGVVQPQTGVMTACDSMNQLNGFPVYKVYLPMIQR